MKVIFGAVGVFGLVAVYGLLVPLVISLAMSASYSVADFKHTEPSHSVFSNRVDTSTTVSVIDDPRAIVFSCPSRHRLCLQVTNKVQRTQHRAQLMNLSNGVELRPLEMLRGGVL